MTLDEIPEKTKGRLRQAIKEFAAAPEKISPDNQRIFEALSKNSPVPVHVRESPITLYSGGGGFSYGEKDPDHIELHPLMATQPATLAHELGHAYFRKESPYAKYIQNRATGLAHGLSLPIVQGIGYAAGWGMKNPAKYLLAPAAAIAMNAPRLYDEHQAWNRAHKLLKEHGATAEDLAYAEALRNRALMTYWTVPAASALAGVATTGLSSFFKKKVAHALPGVEVGAKYRMGTVAEDAQKTVLAHYGLGKDAASLNAMP